MPSARTTLRRSMIDGTAYSVMVGAGELYFPAFVYTLALGEVATGLVASLPPVVGALLSLVSPWAVARLGSHKRWATLAAGLQALAFVPMILGAALGHMPAWLIFAVASLYWFGGFGAGAAWSTWIGTLVPRRLRSRWFGLRSRAIQAGTLAGFLLTGLTLGLVTGWESVRDADPETLRRVMLAFAGLFLFAGLCRVLSTALLARQHEPDPLPAGTRAVPLRELWTRVRAHPDSHTGRDVRLILYVACVWFASNTAAPFINPYLLEIVGVGYLPYALLVGLVMLGKALTLATLGRVAARYGARRLLLVGGLGLTPIGLFWALSSHVAWLAAVQLYSGVVWACFELGLWLLLLDHLKEEERTSLMGIHFLGNYSAMALGSLVGASLLRTLGEDAAAYHWVFILSTVARVATAVLLLRIVRTQPEPGPPRTPLAQATDREALPAAE